MKKCNVCSRHFLIKKTEVYQVQDLPPCTGIGFIMPPKSTTLDAIDCPYCSCQQVLAARLPKKPEDTK